VHFGLREGGSGLMLVGEGRRELRGGESGGGKGGGGRGWEGFLWLLFQRYVHLLPDILIVPSVKGFVDRGK